MWPVVNDRVLYNFQKSLCDAKIPSQWKQARVIPLRKLGESDYTLARVWRPISLLPTLSKVFEAVMA